MDKNGRMSFKNFIFPVNPTVIRIAQKNNVTSVKVPFGKDIVSNLGSQLRIITGEGEFFGIDCTDQFEQLKKTASDGGGMLYLPSQKPVFAILESLEMKCSDIDNVIAYSFRFAETSPADTFINDFSVYGNGTDCLWDFSWNYHIDIDSLVSLNPHIKRPDIPVGVREKVRLC